MTKVADNWLSTFKPKNMIKLSLASPKAPPLAKWRQYLEDDFSANSSVLTSPEKKFPPDYLFFKKLIPGHFIATSPPPPRLLILSQNESVSLRYRASPPDEGYKKTVSRQKH